MKTLQWDTPEDLGQQLLEGLDLSKYSALWEVQEKGSENEFLLIQGTTFFITLSPVVHSCEEGRFIARLYATPSGECRRKGWPRYYFDRYRAKCELETWLVYNSQLPIKNNEQNQNEDNQ